MFLGVWIYFFTDRLLYGQRPWATSAGLLSVTLAFLYSHGAGFLIFFSTTSYALYFLFETPAEWQMRRRPFLRWSALQLLVALYYAPWLYRAATLRVAHTLQPDLPAITNTLSLLLLGFGALSIWLRWGSVLFMGVLISALYMTDRTSRTLILAFIVVPVVMTLGISYLYRPIWLHRPLAYTVPFLAILLALAAVKSMTLLDRVRLGALARYTFIGAVGGVLILAAANQQARIYYPWRIREAAHFLQQVAQPGDRIDVPDFKVFWGMSWYFVGPGSVNPLQQEGAWAMRNGVTLLAGSNGFDTGAAASCNWLVYRTMDLPLLPTNHAQVVHEFDDLFVAEQCAAGR